MATMKSYPIANSVALVTGTNKPNGIGCAIVHALLAQGASKVYATARDASQLQDLVRQTNNKVVPVSLDVTDLQAIEKLPDKCPDVTLLVNNAGYIVFGNSSVGDVEGIKKEMEVNYIAPMALVKAFKPVFDNYNNRPTAVVNINSIAGLVNMPFGSTYSSSKAACHSLTQAQRRDLPNTLVMCVYPGPIVTDLNPEGNFPDMGKPDQVAQEIMQGLGNGVEDVFPDNFSKKMSADLRADPKGVEKQMLQG